MGKIMLNGVKYSSSTKDADTLDGKHASDFVNKHGDTMTGDLIVPNTRPNISNPTLPVSGSLVLPDLINLRDYRSFLGTYSKDGNSDWNYLINIRHRNGFGDGNLYGMYIKAPLSADNKNLSWGFQHIEEWSKERILLDSVNYKNYCTPANIGLGNVNNTPDYLKQVKAASYLSSWGDTRNVETKPSDYSEMFKPVGLKTPAASKITTGSSFATLVGIRGWSDSSAGKAHELAFDGGGKLLHRVGLTSWEGWREIAYTDLATTTSAGLMSASDKDTINNALYYYGNDEVVMRPKGEIYFDDDDYSDGGERNQTTISANHIFLESSYYEETTGGELIEEHGYHTVEINTSGIHATGYELCFNVTEYNETKGVTLSRTDFHPDNQSMDLGSSNSSYRWRNIYAANGIIQTSDRTKKTNINNLDIQKIKSFIMGLIPSSYEMIDGTSGRTHYGLIAQDIEELMKKLNMGSSDFAGFIKSPKKIIKYEDENGKKLKKPIEEVLEGEYDYALRYDEFIAPLIKVVQEQQKTIEQQQRMIEQQQIAIKNQQKEIEQIKKELSKMDSSM